MINETYEPFTIYALRKSSGRHVALSEMAFQSIIDLSEDYMATFGHDNKALFLQIGCPSYCFPLVPSTPFTKLVNSIQQDDGHKSDFKTHLIKSIEWSIEIAGVVMRHNARFPHLKANVARYADGFTSQLELL